MLRIAEEQNRRNFSPDSFKLPYRPVLLNWTSSERETSFYWLSHHILGSFCYSWPIHYFNSYSPAPANSRRCVWETGLLWSHGDGEGLSTGPHTALLRLWFLQPCFLLACSLAMHLADFCCLLLWLRNSRSCLAPLESSGPFNGLFSTSVLLVFWTPLRPGCNSHLAYILGEDPVLNYRVNSSFSRLSRKCWIPFMPMNAMKDSE